MAKLVVYQGENGSVCLVAPSPEAVSKWGVEAIARKDVPAGKPFRIVNATDIPSDPTFFEAWEVDPASLTDGVGAESNDFPAEATP